MTSKFLKNLRKQAGRAGVNTRRKNTSVQITNRRITIDAHGGGVLTAPYVSSPFLGEFNIILPLNYLIHVLEAFETRRDGRQVLLLKHAIHFIARQPVTSVRVRSLTHPCLMYTKPVFMGACGTVF